MTVEVWGGGDPRRKVNVHTLAIVNESDLAERSKYDVWLDGEQVGTVRHNRSDGALVLTQKAIRLALRAP